MSVDANLFPMMKNEITIEPFLGQDRANVLLFGDPELFLGKLTFEERALPSEGDDPRTSTAKFTMRDFVKVDTRSRVTFPNKEIDQPRILARSLHYGINGEQSHAVLFF